MRILCVDDDGLVLAVTADLLRDLGHDVIEAAGGHRAAQAIGDGGIDLLVTDIHMPGGPDGQELAAMARRAQPDLPVIYFSGLAHIVPVGVKDTVLHKPCTLGELELAIDNIAQVH